jgi:antitoxin (DNA-binding transcriptional repressor) of toxin-antitoxin stability system
MVQTKHPKHANPPSANSGEEIITATELARNLSTILDRVHTNGEHFVITHHGETVALLGPTPSPQGRRLSEILERIGDLQMPGDGFADDLEAIQAEQGLAEFHEWPT